MPQYSEFFRSLFQNLMLLLTMNLDTYLKKLFSLFEGVLFEGYTPHMVYSPI